MKKPGTRINTGFPTKKGERETGFEPATFALARRRSTPEPLALICFVRFGLHCFALVSLANKTDDT